MSMCMHISAGIYACMSVCRQACIYVYVHIYTYYIHPCIQTCMNICIYVYIGRHALAYICECMYINTHYTYTYLCMHACEYEYMLYECFHLGMYKVDI